MNPNVFFVTITVKRLKTTGLAFVLLPVIRFTVQLLMVLQVNLVSEGLLTNIAGPRLFVSVHTHVRHQSRLHVKPFVADLAEHHELFIMSFNVKLQVIF